MKTALVACALIIAGSTSYAANLAPWDKLPVDTKEIIIKQYINGYLAGMNSGVSEGIKSTINYTKTTGSNTYIDNKTNIYTECSNIINSNIDRIYDDTRGWQQIQNKGVNFYINEMTAFLKKYPLCNKTAVTDLVELLTPVWLNVETNTTYDDIGRGCAK
ncbi:hypothetical protein OR1_00141 [Geobacter sp. OR-1]|uniref:hypothetical protein n=1 Tax=Geobacter sp. OR-1 TaxID=1266765 RepID=UPI000542FB56|nr:hypothetical protein [Geobacter sp. OR-1]GAM07872.1 hypothetical protein OR1_00141 [Geobacter sp. OR-1]